MNQAYADKCHEKEGLINRMWKDFCIEERVLKKNITKSKSTSDLSQIDVITYHYAIFLLIIVLIYKHIYIYIYNCIGISSC